MILSDCDGGVWAVVILRRMPSVCGVCVREWQEESASACRPSTCLYVFGLVSVSGRVCCACPVTDLVFGPCLHLCLSSGRAACLSNDPSCLQICPFFCCPLICRAVCPSSGLGGAPSIHLVVSPVSLPEASCTAQATHLAHVCLVSLQMGYLLVSAPLIDLWAAFPLTCFLNGAVKQLRAPYLRALAPCLGPSLLPREVE